MRNVFRKLALIALSALLIVTAAPPASAEDCFTLDVDMLDMDSLNSDDYVSRNLSAQTQGICVTKHISDSSELAERVRLTVTRMDTQALLFDKDYGYQSGQFRSDAIYLPYVDSHTVPYLVTLYVENMVYAMPFMHLRARLRYNGGCTMGARLGELDPALSDDWLMGTMVDLSELRTQGYAEIDVCASGSYIVGKASLTMQGDELTVQLGFYSAANVELNYYSLYVITDCSQFTTSDVSRLLLPSYSLGQAVNVSGADSVLIYMPMQLSYDPDQSLQAFYYDFNSASRQCALFEQNRGASGAEFGAVTDSDAGWSDGADGWSENNGGWDGGGNDGWGDNSGWDYGGNDGWGDNSGWDDGGCGGWGDNSGISDNPIWGDGSIPDDGQ